MTTTLYLDVESHVLSSVATTSNRFCDIEFTIREDAAFLDDNPFVRFPKIFAAILKKHVVMLVSPPVTLFRASAFNTKDPNFIEKSLLFCIETTAIDDFLSWKDRVTCSQNETADCVNALRALLGAFSFTTREFLQDHTYQFLLPLQSFLTQRVYLDESCNVDEIVASGAHMTIARNWQQKSFDIAQFLQKRRGITSISFGPFPHPFSVDTQRRDGENFTANDLFSHFDSCTCLSGGFHGSTDVLAAVASGHLKNLRNLHFFSHDVMDLSVFCILPHELPKLETLSVVGQQFQTASLDIDIGETLVNALRCNTTLQKISMPDWNLPHSSFPLQDVGDYFMQRNAELAWKAFHCKILDFCLIMYSLYAQGGIWLPPYVILEIVDHFAMDCSTKLFPNHSIGHLVNHSKKIGLIISVGDSVKRQTLCRK